MAQKARRLSVQYFGRTVQLFIPLYISNYCSNQCLYCGFNRTHAIERRKLTLAEIECEAQAIASTGMQHLLLLTGESLQATPMDYLEAAVRLLKRYFASVSIEIFPLDEAPYRQLKAAGVDGLTLYQETYDRSVLPAGPPGRPQSRLPIPSGRTGTRRAGRFSGGQHRPPGGAGRKTA